MGHTTRPPSTATTGVLAGQLTWAYPGRQQQDSAGQRAATLVMTPPALPFPTLCCSIVSGWTNRPLDSLGFYTALEHGVKAVFDMEPRSWYDTPEDWLEQQRPKSP